MDLYSASADNFLVKRLPNELFKKIIGYVPVKYGNLAQTCKFFYRLTRPIHYQCMKEITENDDRSKERMKFCRHKMSTDMFVPARIAFYMTISSGNKFEVWASLYLRLSEYDLSTLFGVLRRDEKFAKLVSPGLLSRLQKGVLEDENLFYSLCVACAENRVFSVEQLEDLIKSNLEAPNSMKAKRQALVRLLVERDDLKSVRRVLEHCVYPSKDTVTKQIIYTLAQVARLFGGGKFSITEIQIANFSIHEIVLWYKSLEKYGNDVKFFKSVFAEYLPKELATANEFARRLGRESIYIRRVRPYLVYLFNEDFCKRHQFSVDDCVALLLSEDLNQYIFDVLEEAASQATEWSKKIMTKVRQQIPTDSQTDRLGFMIFMGRPMEEYTQTKKIGCRHDCGRKTPYLQAFDCGADQDYRSKNFPNTFTFCW